MTDEAPDPDALVQRYWPYDGPHTPAHIDSAARAAAGLMRYLARATSTELPAEQVYELLGGWHATVAGMEQLARQLGEHARTWAIDPRLSADGGEAPRDRALAVAEAFSQARDSIDMLTGELDDAREVLAGLYHATKG